MRKTHSTKVLALIGGAALSVAVAGTAYAYWTTTGTGSGSGSANSGVSGVSALSFTQTAIDGMYPGDSAQTLTVAVKNAQPSGGQNVYVTTVKAWLAVTEDVNAPAGTCDASDFLLGGESGRDSLANAKTMTWTATELAPQGQANAVSSIQFNNKASNQDACKNASVTINYDAS